MTATNLQAVADQVIRRAQERGYVVQREVREELRRAGIAETLWKDVLALGRASLSFRKGRYYYSAPVSDRVRAEQSHQRDIQSAVEKLLQSQQGSSSTPERREQDRVEFVQTVKVITEDGQELTLLSRDLSTTGIRLVGTRRLLGQKVRVIVPSPDGPAQEFRVRILWTCPVGEDLVENGGSFVLGN
jgi:hypothetical protein